MLTEAAARWTIFVVFFFWDLGFLEVQTDNRLNNDCWLGEAVMGIVPKQLWMK